MSDLVFPQVGDLPDAAFFSSLIGRGTSGVISGLSFSADFTVPEVTVAAGKAIIATGTETTQHPNITPAKTVRDTAKIVDIDAQTVGLASGAVNSVLLDANTGADDAGAVITNTTGNRPPETVKIGEIDTTAGSTAVSEGWNRIANGVLTFPDRAAAEEQSDFLREGTIVFDRSENRHFNVV
jgi:hypothetical protein